MKFAKWSFLIAGIYGILLIAPMYFTEAQIGIDYPPAIAHPEYFYGFLGVTLAWQIAFLVISRDPVKYRLLMLPAIIEKFSFVIAVAVLYFQHRIPDPIVAGGTIDLVLGTLFTLSFIKTRTTAQQ